MSEGHIAHVFVLFPDLVAAMEYMLTSTHDLYEHDHDAHSLQKLRLITR